MNDRKRCAGSELARKPALASVAINRIDAVALPLAERLLDAGYDVVGENVRPECRQSFESAGGQVLDSLRAQCDWTILLKGSTDPDPEQMAGLTFTPASRRRPRVALLGANPDFSDPHRLVVTTLQISSGAAPDIRLMAQLTVDRSGLELGVSGDAGLFQEALPLLTALSDRVLFAATGLHSSN